MPKLNPLRCCWQTTSASLRPHHHNLASTSPPPPPRPLAQLSNEPSSSINLTRAADLSRPRLPCADGDLSRLTTTCADASSLSHTHTLSGSHCLSPMHLRCNPELLRTQGKRRCKWPTTDPVQPPPSTSHQSAVRRQREQKTFHAHSWRRRTCTRWASSCTLQPTTSWRTASTRS
jgi:hypothetical protein